MTKLLKVTRPGLLKRKDRGSCKMDERMTDQTDHCVPGVFPRGDVEEIGLGGKGMCTMLRIVRMLRMLAMLGMLRMFDTWRR